MSRDGTEDESKKNLPLKSLDKIVGGSADMQSRFILDEPSRSPDAFDSGSSEVKLEPVGPEDAALGAPSQMAIFTLAAVAA